MNKTTDDTDRDVPSEVWLANIDRVLLIRAFITALIFLLFVSIPIWSNKVYYGDDFLRLYTGDASTWTSNGRPFTTLLQRILTFSTTISDISPIPLLFGITFLSFSAALFVSSLQTNLPTLQVVLLSLGIVANPFFVQPMLYIWDSVSILSAFSLAMLAAIINYSNQLKSAAITIIVLLCMLMLYQISINLYVSCVTVSVYCFICRKRPIFRFILSKVCAVIVALLMYKIFIASAVISDTYSIEQSQLATFDADFIKTIPFTVMGFFSFLQLAYPGWRVIFFVLPALLAFVCATIKTIALSQDKTRPHRVPVLIIVFLSPLFIIFFVLGVSLFLKIPLIAPRTMPAYSAFTLFCMIVAFSTFKTRLRVAIIMSFIVSIMYTSVTMVATFNTIIKEQSYLSSVIWMIKSDVARMPVVKNITFINIIKQFPDTKSSRTVFPMIDKISPAVTRYTYEYFFMNRSVGLPVIKPTGEMLHFRTDVYASRSCDYRLFILNETAVVDFNTDCNISR